MAGPRLTTLIAFLKGVCHASFSTIRKFLRDVVGLTISRGQLAKIISKVTQALDEPYRELLEQLPSQSRLNVDETGIDDPAWNERVRPNFTFGAVSGITIITRFSNFMPAKAMPFTNQPI